MGSSKALPNLELKTESLSKDIEELEEQTGIDTDSHNDDESQE